MYIFSVVRTCIASPWLELCGWQVPEQSWPHAGTIYTVHTVVKELDSPWQQLSKSLGIYVWQPLSPMVFGTEKHPSAVSINLLPPDAPSYAPNILYALHSVKICQYQRHTRKRRRIDSQILGQPPRKLWYFSKTTWPCIMHSLCRCRNSFLKHEHTAEARTQCAKTCERLKRLVTILLDGVQREGDVRDPIKQGYVYPTRQSTL